MAVSDWEDLMPHTVTLKTFQSRDTYGKPTYSAGTDYSARVVYKPRMTKDSDGKDVVARGRVWLSGTPDMTPEDQIVLPDGSTPPILSVNRFADQDGDHHVEIDFG